MDLRQTSESKIDRLFQDGTEVDVIYQTLRPSLSPASREMRICHARAHLTRPLRLTSYLFRASYPSPKIIVTWFVGDQLLILTVDGENKISWTRDTIRKLITLPLHFATKTENRPDLTRIRALGGRCPNVAR